MDRSAYLAGLHAGFAVPAAELTAFVAGACGPVQDLSRLVRGDEYEVHRVRLRSGAVVYARIAQPGAQEHKVDREAAVMQRARAAGAPVPEVLQVAAIGDRRAMLVREVPGLPLSDLAPSPAQRDRILERLGHVLRTVHTVRMPVEDPAQHRRTYFRNLRRAAESLREHGYLDRIDPVLDRVAAAEDLPAAREPVLCHNDVSALHVYVDPDTHAVTGLIDWGLWGAGSGISDLADVGIRMNGRDLQAVARGYGYPLQDPDAAEAVRRFMLAKLIGGIAWNITSDQDPGALVARLAHTLRTG